MSNMFDNMCFYFSLIHNSLLVLYRKLIHLENYTKYPNIYSVTIILQTILFLLNFAFWYMFADIMNLEPGADLGGAPFCTQFA